MGSTTAQVCLNDHIMFELDAAALEIGVSRSRLCRMIVELWLADPQAVARMRAARVSRTSSPTTPATIPATYSAAWIRATLLSAAPGVAGMSDAQVLDLASRGEVPALLARQRALEQQPRVDVEDVTLSMDDE